VSTDITGYFAGDDLDIQRDVTGVISSDPLVKAWFTVKVYLTDADPGALQKVITTAQVVGVGQITQDGSVGNGDGTASLLFQCTAAETLTLGWSRTYNFDVQVKTGSGRIFTVDSGTLTLLERATAAIG
jgi:hypothetical protein